MKNKLHTSDKMNLHLHFQNYWWGLLLASHTKGLEFESLQKVWNEEDEYICAMVHFND
jgi:hypothetical protein